MQSVLQRGFELDRRLETDSEPLLWLGLCELRLMNDTRWPWVILVPQRIDIEELHELTPLDQAMLTFETNLVAQGLKQVTGCTKINVGALGNIVRQLHVHVVARNEGDPAWPGPVWGFGTAEPRTADETKTFSAKLLAALAP